MFGGDDDDEQEEVVEKEEPKPRVPKKLKHDGCPLEGDPAGAKVRVMDEGELYPAKIRSYEPDSNTYTIMWSSSGVLQYRTKPENINWDPFVEEVVVKAEEKKDEDELWIAARRGSLQSVKKFIENGVHFNETGKMQQRTPFYHAVFCGHAPVVEYLISLGARDSDDTAFITANAQIRDLLLKSGAGGKRRASVHKASEKTHAPTASEMEADKALHAKLRKASVAKMVSAHLAEIEGEVSKTQFEALKALEERLVTIEAAMRAETRRPSLAITKEAASKRRSFFDPAPKKNSVEVATGEHKDEPKEAKVEPTTEKSAVPVKANNVQTGNQAIVNAVPKKRLNPIVRFFVAVMPKGIFGKRKGKKTTT